jgi:hypothetical protein
MRTLIENLPYLIMIVNYSMLLGLFSYGLYQGLMSTVKHSTLVFEQD